MACVLRFMLQMEPARSGAGSAAGAGNQARQRHSWCPYCGQRSRPTAPPCAHSRSPTQPGRPAHQTRSWRAGAGEGGGESDCGGSPMQRAPASSAARLCTHATAPQWQEPECVTRAIACCCSFAAAGCCCSPPAAGASVRCCCCCCCCWPFAAAGSPAAAAALPAAVPPAAAPPAACRTKTWACHSAGTDCSTGGLTNHSTSERGCGTCSGQGAWGSRGGQRRGLQLGQALPHRHPSTMAAPAAAAPLLRCAPLPRQR